VCLSRAATIAAGQSGKQKYVLFQRRNVRFADLQKSKHLKFFTFGPLIITTKTNSYRLLMQ